MPELPEVQTIVNDLNQKILHQKIQKVEIKLEKLIKGDPGLFLKHLKNNSFQKISRRGKLIIMQLTRGNKFLLLHLRMTGQIIYQNQSEIIAGGHSDSNTIKNLPNKHTRLIIHFANQGRLFFNDQRQFGVAQIVDNKELEIIKSKFGLEPLEKDFTLNNFLKKTDNKKINIKAFLLDQKHIAGIGNIYADEILFSSNVLPDRQINTLSKEERNKIFLNIPKILKKAIKYRGTTFNDYVDASGRQGSFVKMLKVYGRQGQACKKCSTPIQKTRIAGRGTSFCPNCQK